MINQKRSDEYITHANNITAESIELKKYIGSYELLLPDMIKAVARLRVIRQAATRILTMLKTDAKKLKEDEGE